MASNAKDKESKEVKKETKEVKKETKETKELLKNQPRKQLWRLKTQNQRMPPLWQRMIF